MTRFKSLIKDLHYRGNINLLQEKIVAVIGRRDSDERSRQTSFDVGKIMAENGYVVMNGLAIGCDTYAVRGALCGGGRVIAVIPCGLDNIYPASNRKLADEICEKGGLLISQYPAGNRPNKYQFLKRDELMAKIADKIYVVDAGLEGGTMYTAKMALKSFRQVECFADTEDVMPKGNIYLMDKYHLRGIRNKEELLVFLNEEEPRQLTLWDDVATANTD